MAAVFTPAYPTVANHSRLFFTPSNLSVYQARAVTTHADEWNSIRSWLDARASGTGAYTDSYYDDKDAEYVGAFGFGYRLDPSRTDWANRGRQLALYFANKTIPTSSRKRQYGMGLAMAYSWLYDYLNQSERQSILNKLDAYVELMYLPNDNEFFWGTDHGDMCAAAFILCSILEDGDSTQNARWRSRLDTVLDKFHNNTNVGCYFPIFRYFGDVDGSTPKTIGPHGYIIQNQEFYARLAPVMLSSLGINWWSTEPWLTNIFEYVLWHYRGDRSVFREGENSAFSKLSKFAQLHAYQVADRNNNSLGEHAQWFGDEVENVETSITSGNYLFGPFKMYRILFRDPTRTPIRPTVARYANKQMKVFKKKGKVVFRTGWEPDDTVFTYKVPTGFLGGHAGKRNEGGIQLARSLPLLVEHGHYDPNQVATYLTSGSSTITGHRYSYGARSFAFNVFRIWDSDEPSENPIDSFQRQLSSTTRFGKWNGSSVDIINDGGQLWPKSAALTPQKSQPSDLADLLAESKWQYDGFDGYDPVEDEKMCYAVGKLTQLYYSAKCTSYKRHILWVKRGQIPGWNYPVIIVFDDLNTHVDSVKGKLTQVMCLQTNVALSGTVPNLQLDRLSERVFFRFLNPTVEKVAVSGFKDAESPVNTYAATNTDNYDDSLAGVERTEINPAVSGSLQEFLLVIFPCTSSQGSPPTATIYNAGGEIGATVGGILCKMKKASPYAATIGVSTDATPPSVPGSLVGTPKNLRVDLDWADSTDNVAVSHYIIERSAQL